MNNRPVEIINFLAQTGWDDSIQRPLQADFSSRRFARLERGNENKVHRAILMDADAGQKTGEFVAIAKLLRDLDLSAPDIYAADAATGLVLMEDFGDRNLGRLADSGEDAKLFYRRAVDGLLQLHKHFDLSAIKDLNLPVFDVALFAAQVELFLDGWLVLTKERAATADERDSFCVAWKKALTGIEALPRTLMLRDYMLDNLMDLPDRTEWRSVGMLDFQDGGIGPSPYDLVSLCEVVRRDGGDIALDDMIGYYHERAASPLSREELRRACQVFAAQRHTRILGIIANRVLKTGQQDKLEYVPRIWGYLDQLLQNESLSQVKIWMEEHFPVQDRTVKA